MTNTVLPGESVAQFNTILINNAEKNIKNSELLENSLHYSAYNNNISQNNFNICNIQNDTKNLNNILVNDNKILSVSAILTIRFLMQGKVKL